MESGRGRLVGVGVGPGEPELMTVRAVNVLNRADRVFAPTSAADEPGRAESIVVQMCRDIAVERVVVPMDTEPARHYRTAAETICSRLDAGEEVAFATLGDPNIYSTFTSIASHVTDIRPRARIATVAGITAFQALAALTNTTIVDGTESLSLVTALDGSDRVAEVLGTHGRGVVVYKGGRYMADIARLVGEAGRCEGAVVGELMGLPGQNTGPLCSTTALPSSYLSTVIVPPGRARP